MSNFSQLFDIIYNKYCKFTLDAGVKKSEISQLAMARFLDVTKGKMQAWQRGQWPAAEDLAVIARKLGFSHRWLMTGEGEPEEFPAGVGLQAVVKPLRAVAHSPAAISGWEAEKEDMEKEIETLRTRVTDLRDHIATQNELLAIYKERAEGRPPRSGNMDTPAPVILGAAPSVRQDSDSR